MKKNMMMRIASVLLVAVLLSTCAISGTFAKYTTSANGSDSARVAYWGWGLDTEMNLSGLFLDTYGTTDVDSADGADVIAPGAAGEAKFQYAYKDYNKTIKAPEVDYTFTITVTESCNNLIKNNANIKWSLDGEEMEDWDALVLAILNLSGARLAQLGPGTSVTEGTQHVVSVKYNAGEIPEAFEPESYHTISWEWVFDDTDKDNDETVKYVVNDEEVEVNTENVTQEALTQDEYDTLMGNADVLDNCSITIEIEITQVTGETTEAVDPAT